MSAFPGPVHREVTCVLPCAGTGSRFQAAYPKELQRLRPPRSDRWCHTAVVSAARIPLGSAGHEPAAARLAGRLATLMGNDLSRTLFVNSGSEAMEAALRIASDYWACVDRPRHRVISFACGYHGSTALCQALTGLPHVKHHFQPPLAVTRVEVPVPPAELRRPESLVALTEAFERALNSDTGPADVIAVVVEPLLNVGGGIVLPPGFLRALRQLCDRAGVLLIVDEVFTGYGRTGRAFGFAHDVATPDIVTSSKGLTGGYVPLATVTTNQLIYQSFQADWAIGGLRYGHTTSDHSAACAAALAVLDVLDEERLIERAETLGDSLGEGLVAAIGHPEVLDVRGLGLVAIVEMSSPAAAQSVTWQARQQGVLVRAQGSAVMAIPPLVIDAAGVEEIVAVVLRALAASQETTMQAVSPGYSG